MKKITRRDFLKGSAAGAAGIALGAMPVFAAAEEEDLSPITFDMYLADNTNGNWDNPVANAITEATGVSLNITYPVTSTGDPGEDVALMIASADYPDLIYAKTSATDLYDAGALLDMTDLIEEYGPNIKKMYGDELEKLKWGNGDDGIYQLSYAGVGAVTLTTGGSAQIQWAAVEENNYEYPTTVAEYEALIKQYLENHPTTDDGLDMIGITISAADWHWMITLGNPAGFIADAAEDNGQWLIDEDYNVIYKHTSENEREYFRWLCRMYNEGILDPDFATQTDDDYIAKIATGRVVGILDSEWHYNQAESVLLADGKPDQTYLGLPLTLYDDQVSKCLLYQGLTVGYGMAISSTCSDPVRAIKFLDYLCSDEGQILYHWGVEGVNYFLDDDGQPYRTEEEINAYNTDTNYAKDTGIENYTGFPIYGTGTYTEDGFPYTRTTRESVIENYNEAEQKGCKALGIEMLTDIFPQADEFELLPYSALWGYQQPAELGAAEDLLDEIAWPAMVKAVTGSEDDFDATWDAMLAELEANGLEDVEAQMTEFLAEKIIE